MNKLFTIIAATIMLSSFAMANDEGIAITLASNHVDVSTSFSGANVTVFGTRTKSGDISIVLSGQDVDVIVRRKQPILGVWVNKDAIAFPHFPAYYDYATDNTDDDLMNINSIIPDGEESRSKFRSELIMQRQDKGLISKKAKEIKFITKDVFRVDFSLPANTPVGEYKVAAILHKNGKEIARQTQDLSVRQVGVGGQAAYFSRNSPWIYGIVCVLFAITSGFIMSVVSIRK